MFVISELQDSVEISAASPDKLSAVWERLRLKYTSVLVETLGLAVFVCRVVDVLEYAVQGDRLVADVIFEAVFYRFYQNEIVFGKILRQEEERIVVGDELHNTYEVAAADLFENCEFEGGESESKWIWNYKGMQLPFMTGESVRLRVKGLRFIDGVVEATMNDQGLGHVAWWD